MNPDLFDPDNTITELYSKINVLEAVNIEQSNKHQALRERAEKAETERDRLFAVLAWAGETLCCEFCTGRWHRQDPANHFSPLCQTIRDALATQEVELGVGECPDCGAPIKGLAALVGHQNGFCSGRHTPDSTQESNDARGYGNLDSCDCSAGRRIKNLPHDSKCPMFDRK